MTNTLRLAGQLEQLIRLETPLENAYAYFSDFGNIVGLFPGIERIMHFRDDRYRLIFAADDERGHEAGIVFDVRCEQELNQVIKVLPVPTSAANLDQIELKHKKLELFFPGQFSSELYFERCGRETKISYRVELLIEFEIPKFLKFIPKKALQNMGDSLMQKKMRSTTSRLAENINQDFWQWFRLRTESAG